MRRYLAFFTLVFTLFFGLATPTYASSETTSDTYTFSWTAALSKTIGGVVVAIPAIAYLHRNNHKEDK